MTTPRTAKSRSPKKGIPTDLNLPICIVSPSPEDYAALKTSCEALVDNPHLNSFLWWLNSAADDELGELCLAKAGKFDSSVDFALGKISAIREIIQFFEQIRSAKLSTIIQKSK